MDKIFLKTLIKFVIVWNTKTEEDKEHIFEKYYRALSIRVTKSIILLVIAELIMASNILALTITIKRNIWRSLFSNQILLFTKYMKGTFIGELWIQFLSKYFVRNLRAGSKYSAL